jgi:23S rRNA (uracil1939-C5)-methyltransferase
VPACVHRPRCGGCPLFERSESEQHHEKHARLTTALARYPELGSIAVEALIGIAPRLGYRRRVKWIADQQGGLGLYAEGEDHVVVDIPECQIASPLLASIGNALRSLLRGHEAIRSSLRAIDLREVDGSKALLTLVFPSDAKPNAQAVHHFVDAVQEREPRIIGIAMNEVARQQVQVLGSQTRLIAGVDEAWDETGGTPVFATFGSFVQAHDEAFRAIQSAIIAGVAEQGEALRVLELFAGSGAIGLSLAKAGHHVTAVESFAPAALRIQRAAERAGVRVDAHAEDANVFLDRSHAETFDVIVVDPPRRGLERKLRESIADCRPEQIVYLSCDPDTFARDLADFAWGGYWPSRVVPYDLMPQTREVEILAFLFRAPPPEPPTRLETSFGRIMEGPSDGTTPFGLHVEGRVGSRSLDVIALVKGVTRQSGRLFDAEGWAANYERIDVIGGHSRIAIHIDKRGGPRKRRAPWKLLVAACARIGHPILGSARIDRETARFMFEKIGIDRSMMDVVGMTLADGTHVTGTIAGDLALAIARLGRK